MNIKINEKVFNSLINKVKELKPGERDIILNAKIKLTFRYCIVKVGELMEDEVQFPVLNPETDNNKIISLVFDAKGLHNKFITEIEVLRENELYVMYVVPERNENDIKSFRQLLEI
jgi:hypothetical protein